MPIRSALGCALLAALIGALIGGCTSGGTDGTPHPAAAAGSPSATTASSTSTSAPGSAPRTSIPTAGTPTARIPTPPTSTPPTSTPPTPTRTAPRPAPGRSRPQPPPGPTRSRPNSAAAALPLGYDTGAARQVITVVAPAQSDTTGTVQAWRRVPGGWRRVGPAVPAFLGSDGMTPHPSEQISATPMGSYTLTQAFGYDSDPGTGLRYTRTTPADWWISQPGPLYNTLQRCTSACGFTQGDPNEHLYYTRPYYAYAAVIDYNTRNAGPVRQGAGSAFFLHVAVGAPTAGCVSIAAAQLVRILRWLDPARHPRILIGTS